MEDLVLDLSILLVGAAFLAYLAVILKQPIIIAYILCGILVGPWGFGLIRHVEFIETISHFGITLLLFLAGLCLHPQKLIGLFKKTSLVTLANCASSFIAAFLFSLLFRFSVVDSLCIALALMFSSTILVIKLLPTTKLHQKRMGAICISVLIMQDLLAIAVLAFIRCIGSPQGALISSSILLIKLCLFLVILVLFERYVLRKVMSHVERIHEVLFVLGLAWCFGVASISNQMGLFYETGAFFAGIVLARHKIAFFISEKLKPLRDFFLVLFFFALGANLNLFVMMNIFIPSIILALVFIMIKPWIFKKAFLWAGEGESFSHETGMRLGQLSEFSLLIALLAFELGHISNGASQLIQLTTILTFIVSSYLVVYKYPTPIGTSEELIRD
ncbi:MAG: cation:proton antiporter [Candidatus Omnitrophica bacterium]|nr:cation:proton antiporter [Candidatus Omnitrophota bacterium]